MITGHLSCSAHAVALRQYGRVEHAAQPHWHVRPRAACHPVVRHRGYDHGRKDRRQHQDRHAAARRQELLVSRSTTARSARKCSTSASSTPRPACSPTIPASPRPASCESKITYIDGDEGVLLYRGYPIDRARRARRFSRDLLPAALRRTADRRAKGGFRRSRDRTTRWFTSR